MSLMPFAQWMNMTSAGYLSGRGAELKALDAAFQKFERSNQPEDRVNLVYALRNWMDAHTRKGENWRATPCNKHRAVETLWHQLTGFTNKLDSNRSDIAGAELVSDDSRKLANALFRDKKVSWKQRFEQQLATHEWEVKLELPTASGDAGQLTGGATGRGLQQALRRAASENIPGAGSVDQGMALGKDLWGTLIAKPLEHEVKLELSRLVPNFHRDLAAALAPFWGVIKDGDSSVWGNKDSLLEQWRIEWGRYHHGAPLTRTAPREAMNAIIRILEAERNHGFSLPPSPSITGFAGKLAATFAAGGTIPAYAVGLAACLITLLNVLRVILRDVIERRAALKLMLEERLDASVFEICPAAGCFMLVCLPSTVLVNTVLNAHYGEPGWQDEVDSALRRYLGPLRQMAREALKEHRFTIPQLLNYPGIIARNELTLSLMKQRRGLTSMESTGAWNEPGYQRPPASSSPGAQARA